MAAAVCGDTHRGQTGTNRSCTQLSVPLHKAIGDESTFHTAHVRYSQKLWNEGRRWRTFPGEQNPNTPAGRPGKGTPMMTIVRTKAEAQECEQVVATALDELAREGARRMILAALEIEVEEYRQQYRDARDPRGHALVGNGQARPRRLTVGAGTVTIGSACQ